MPLIYVVIRRICQKAGKGGVEAGDYAKIKGEYTLMLKQVVGKALKYARNFNGSEIRLTDVELSLASLGYALFDACAYNSELPRATFEADAAGVANVHLSDKALTRLICFMDKHLVQYVHPPPSDRAPRTRASIRAILRATDRELAPTVTLPTPARL